MRMAHWFELHPELMEKWHIHLSIVQVSSAQKLRSPFSLTTGHPFPKLNDIWVEFHSADVRNRAH